MTDGPLDNLSAIVADYHNEMVRQLRATDFTFQRLCRCERIPFPTVVLFPRLNRVVRALGDGVAEFRWRVRTAAAVLVGRAPELGR